ncbi:MAG: hypothetical protein ACKVRO_01730 [Micropepsaceae bacterium]
MQHKFILFAGVVTAAILSTSAAPAFADSYDDQAEETRALNVQALAAARGQNGAPMGDMGGVEAGADRNGVGGPFFEVAPGPNDMGDAPPPDSDAPDDADEPEATAPPNE